MIASEACFALLCFCFASLPGQRFSTALLAHKLYNPMHSTFLASKKYHSYILQHIWHILAPKPYKPMYVTTLLAPKLHTPVYLAL